MNKFAIVAALVIALGLVAYGWSPRYTMANIGNGRVVRLDRWSGDVLFCGTWSDDSFACSEAVKDGKAVEVWRDVTPEEMARASAANQADEDAKSAAASARRAGEEAAQAASNAAKKAADAAEAAVQH